MKKKNDEDRQLARAARNEQLNKKKICDEINKHGIEAVIFGKNEILIRLKQWVNLNKE